MHAGIAILKICLKLFWLKVLFAHVAGSTPVTGDAFCLLAGQPTGKYSLRRGYPACLRSSVGQQDDQNWIKIQKVKLGELS